MCHDLWSHFSECQHEVREGLKWYYLVPEADAAREAFIRCPSLGIWIVYQTEPGTCPTCTGCKQTA
jgi:hypothetical protein